MADYAGLDYDQLAQAYMRLLGERGPGYRGIPYEGAGYTSKDPGGQRWREGELSHDVGLLDPVDLLAGALTAPTRTAIKALARGVRPGQAVPFSSDAEALMGQIDTILKRVRESQPGVAPVSGPRPRGIGTGGRRIVRSERGSTGPTPGPASLPGPDDISIPPEMRAEIRNVRERINAAMTESSEASYGYENPEGMEAMYDELVQAPGESLLAYLRRLRRLEDVYNPDQIYGPGEYPPSHLVEVLTAYEKTPAGRAEASVLASAEKRLAEEAASRRQPARGDAAEAWERDPEGWWREQQRVDPYQAGEGPLKRTIEVNEIPPSPQPARANEYADIIRKLFEREGQ